jgi:hypothetical protein
MGRARKAFCREPKRASRTEESRPPQDEDETENGEHDGDQCHPSENAMEQDLVQAVARSVVASFGSPYRCGGNAGTGTVPFRGHDTGARFPVDLFQVVRKSSCYCSHGITRPAAGHDLSVSLQQLYGEETWSVMDQAVREGDRCELRLQRLDGALDLLAVDHRRDGGSVRRRQACVDQSVQSFTCSSRRADDGHAQERGKLRLVNDQTLPDGEVDEIERRDERGAQFPELKGEIQVAFQHCRVDHVDDHVRLGLSDELAADHLFL